MRVLVDTSAWADFFNDHPSPEQRALADLFTGDDEICTCGVVVAEVFQGLRRDEGRARLSDLFRDLTFLEPAGIDFYFRAADLYRALRRRGKTIRSTIDCVIAVLAEEQRLPTISGAQAPNPAPPSRFRSGGTLYASRVTLHAFGMALHACNETLTPYNVPLHAYNVTRNAVSVPLFAIHETLHAFREIVSACSVPLFPLRAIVDANHGALHACSASRIAVRAPLHRVRGPLTGLPITLTACNVSPIACDDPLTACSA